MARLLMRDAALAFFSVFSLFLRGEQFFNRLLSEAMQSDSIGHEFSVRAFLAFTKALAGDDLDVEIVAFGKGAAEVLTFGRRSFYFRPLRLFALSAQE